MFTPFHMHRYPICILVCVLLSGSMGVTADTSLVYKAALYDVEPGGIPNLAISTHKFVFDRPMELLHQEAHVPLEWRPLARMLTTLCDNQKDIVKFKSCYVNTADEKSIQAIMDGSSDMTQHINGAQLVQCNIEL